MNSLGFEAERFYRLIINRYESIIAEKDEEIKRLKKENMELGEEISRLIVKGTIWDEDAHWRKYKTNTHYISEKTADMRYVKDDFLTEFEKRTADALCRVENKDKRDYMTVDEFLKKLEEW